MPIIKKKTNTNLRITEILFRLNNIFYNLKFVQFDKDLCFFFVNKVKMERESFFLKN